MTGKPVLHETQFHDVTSGNVLEEMFCVSRKDGTGEA